MPGCLYQMSSRYTVCVCICVCIYTYSLFLCTWMGVDVPKDVVTYIHTYSVLVCVLCGCSWMWVHTYSVFAVVGRCRYIGVYW